MSATLPEFKAFSKIERIDRLWMTVTQKIHGSNAQIYIEKLETDPIHHRLYAGSRTRWLTPEDDNYGFAKWVHDNKDELVQKLGHGRHYGEWCGTGINNGEGLSGKILVLFDWWNYADAITDGSYPYLMEGVRVVPVLYKGHYSEAKIDEIMADLKTNGSKLTPPGLFLKPEGIVIDINGNKYKKVFEQEETAWKRSDKPKFIRTIVDVDHLLQPIRLEKLISRDERYSRNYPETLRDIVKDYIADLNAEQPIDMEDKNLTKSLGAQLYPFVKHFMESK